MSNTIALATLGFHLFNTLQTTTNKEGLWCFLWVHVQPAQEEENSNPELSKPAEPTRPRLDQLDLRV